MTRSALLLATTLLTGTAGGAAAQLGADWMPMDQVVRKLGEAGYGEIRSLKADDGRWKGKAVKDGRPVSFAVDPRTGAVTERIKPEKEARKGDKGGNAKD